MKTGSRYRHKSTFATYDILITGVPYFNDSKIKVKYVFINRITNKPERSGKATINRSELQHWYFVE